MRYLKQKIAKAYEYHRRLESLRSLRKPLVPPFEVQAKIEAPPEVKIEENCVKKNKPKRPLGNNMMKNYAHAMVNFALSAVAEPYLSSSPLVRVISLQVFRQILAPKKRKTTCIQRLRELLLINKDKDPEEIQAFKSLFQEACKVFLKYFWVNWIYHSRLEDKSKYLKYRSKLLRRIENPEGFTYLESFAPEHKKQKPNNLKRVKWAEI